MQVPEAEPQVPETVELNTPVRRECGHSAAGVQWQLNKGLLGDNLTRVPFQLHLNINLAPKPSISYNPQSHPVNKLLFLLSALCVAVTHQHRRPSRARRQCGYNSVPLDAAENTLDPEI